MVRYDDLTRYLEEQPEDDGVSLTVAELEVFVGQLPPSSNGRTWWANTKGHVQSAASLSRTYPLNRRRRTSLTLRDREQRSLPVSPGVLHTAQVPPAMTSRSGCIRRRRRRTLRCYRVGGERLPDSQKSCTIPGRPPSNRT